MIDPALSRSESRGVGVGDAADLFLVPGEYPASTVMDRPGDRTVIRAGRVVAHDGELL